MLHELVLRYPFVLSYVDIVSVGAKLSLIFYIRVSHVMIRRLLLEAFKISSHYISCTYN